MAGIREGYEYFLYDKKTCDADTQKALRILVGLGQSGFFFPAEINLDVIDAPTAKAAWARVNDSLQEANTLLKLPAEGQICVKMYKGCNTPRAYLMHPDVIPGAGKEELLFGIPPHYKYGVDRQGAYDTKMITRFPCNSLPYFSRLECGIALPDDFNRNADHIIHCRLDVSNIDNPCDFLDQQDLDLGIKPPPSKKI